MSFALPSALLLAGLALPIVVLYVLKVRLRRMSVSTNLFWHQIFDEKPPRSIWQHLRHLLSLLAQLALLALLVLAIADPYLPWQARHARHLVLVVDNSASMQATDVVPTRLDAAKKRAQQWIAGMRDQDQLAIVLAGKSPEVLVGMTGHLPTLRSAIDKIEPSDGTTYLDSALRLGRQLVAPYPKGEVVVLTDGCVKRSADFSPGSAAPESIDTKSPDAKKASGAQEDNRTSVHWELFGTNAANVGITQFQTRRSLVDPLGYEILVAVHNASDVPVSARLELTLDDVPVDIIPLNLAPGEPWQRSLEKTSMEGGMLVATLTKIGPAEESPVDEGADTAETSIEVNHLVADDVAYAILLEQERQKVLLVTPGNFFLQKVFEANPLVELTVLREFPQQWPDDSIVVLHRNVPAKIPSGSVLVIDPEEDCELWSVEGKLENPIVTEQAEDSPLMTHIRMDNVLVPEARKLQWSHPVTPLAATVSGEAVYAEVRRGTGKCLVLGVNLDRSDLAFRTAFPILVTNALTWFAGPGGTLHPAIGTDAILNVELEDTLRDDLEAVLLVSPRDRRTRALISRDEPSDAAGTSSSSTVTVGPLTEIGIWKLLPDTPAEKAASNTASSSAEKPLREIAVNLASSRETDLRPPADLLTRQKGLPQAAAWWIRPPWFYLVAAACLLAACEWVLYQRRLIT